jgi:hypothetical protein
MSERERSSWIFEALPSIAVVAVHGGPPSVGWLMVRLPDGATVAVKLI